MENKTFVLQSTEVIDGEKQRVGQTVTLPDDHPVAIKHAAATAKAAIPAAKRGANQKED